MRYIGTSHLQAGDGRTQLRLQLGQDSNPVIAHDYLLFFYFRKIKGDPVLIQGRGGVS